MKHPLGKKRRLVWKKKSVVEIRGVILLELGWLQEGDAWYFCDLEGICRPDHVHTVFDLYI